MKQIEIKNTNPEFIRMVKLELTAKKERMEKYFDKINKMKRKRKHI
jgi:hypothetical protein